MPSQPPAPRLALLGNSVKENLVARVNQWPSVHAGPALIARKPMEGVLYEPLPASPSR